MKVAGICPPQNPLGRLLRSLNGRLVVTVVLPLVLSCCAPPDAPVLPPPADPMERAEYREMLDRLRESNSSAQAAWEQGDLARTAAILTESQPLAGKLIEARRPPLAAFEAVSDFDQLYAGVLLAKRHTAWARQLYVTNAARWRNWKPETEDTLRRRREAEQGVTECDRRLGLSN